MVRKEDEEDRDGVNDSMRVEKEFALVIIIVFFFAAIESVLTSR